MPTIAAGLSTMQLIVDQTRYAWARRPWPLEYPTVVQFPVNDICDSKCQMCNIWQQKQGREITPADVRQLFANPLFRRVRTVGLNGGEPTLRRDLASLGAALFDALPSLTGLSLITNGLHSARAIQRVDELAVVARERGVRLDVMVSLDGVGGLHDRVRGVPGNFSHALRLLDYIQARPEMFTARVGFTVIRDNVYGLHDLHDFCQLRSVYVKYRLGVPNRRLYNLEPAGARQIGKRSWLNVHPFGLDEPQRWHFAQFLYGLIAGYETSLAQRQFYQSLASQVLHGSPRRAGCDWQHRGVTVSSRGEILYCAVQSKILGDGLAEDPRRLYFGNMNYVHSIVREKCGSCAHDYLGPPGGWQQMQLLTDGALRRFGGSLERARRSSIGRSLVTAKRRGLDPVRFSASRREQLRIAKQVVQVTQVCFDVLICGWYGTETLGDKAILAGIVATLRQIHPSCRVLIASLEPVCTRLSVSQMPELAGCEVIAAGSAVGRVAECRAVIFGGGPLMAIREIAQMEALFVRARAIGVPSIVAGCGVGPLGSAAYNRSIRGLLAAATHRIFRDEQSRLMASRELGIPAASAVVCDDPAVTWLQGIGLNRTANVTRPVLALGLRDWPYHQYAPRLSDVKGERIRNRFEVEVVAALEALAAEVPSLTILPIPFCTHAIGGDDRWLYWRLVRRSRQLRDRCDTGLLAGELAPIEYVNRLMSASAILTMRFHSLVFASTLRIPAVAIDYTEGRGKVHALGLQVGCPVFRMETIVAADLLNALRVAICASEAAPATSGDFAAALACAWRAATRPSSTLMKPA